MKRSVMLIKRNKKERTKELKRGGRRSLTIGEAFESISPEK